MDWKTQALDVFKLLVAYLLALPVGLYREREEHSIGLRTFPLVAVASCAYVLLGFSATVHTADAQSRIIQGLVTGIGFIGGAAIFKGHGNVHGTATAAAIWTTGAMGASVAEDRWALAAGLAALNFFVLRLLLPIKAKLDGGNGANHEQK